MDQEVYDKIMGEITEFCKGCGSSNCCPEDECVLYKIEKICEEAVKPRGTYQCFHCLARNSVVWNSDYDFEDFGIAGDGIVHCCTCSNCGAEIQYYIPINDEEDS